MRFCYHAVESFLTEVLMFNGVNSIERIEIFDSLNGSNVENNSSASEMFAREVVLMTPRLLEALPDHIKAKYPELSRVREFTISFPIVSQRSSSSSSSSINISEVSSDFETLIVNEILLKIFAHLKAPALLMARGVSKRWAQIGSDDSLWKTCYMKKFCSQPMQITSFFKMFHAECNIRNITKSEGLTVKLQEFVHPTEGLVNGHFSGDSSKVITQFQRVIGKTQKNISNITRIWDLATGECQEFDEQVVRGSKTPCQDSYYTISDDGKRVCRVLAESGEVILTDITSEGAESSQTIEGIVGVVPIFSPDSSRLIFRSNHSLYVWNIAEKRLTDVCHLADSRTQIQDIEFSSDRETLCFITYDTKSQFIREMNYSSLFKSQEMMLQPTAPPIEMSKVAGGDKAAVFYAPTPSSSSSQGLKKVFCIYQWTLDSAPQLHYHVDPNPEADAHYPVRGQHAEILKQDFQVLGQHAEAVGQYFQIEGVFAITVGEDPQVFAHHALALGQYLQAVSQHIQAGDLEAQKLGQHLQAVGQNLLGGGQHAKALGQYLQAVGQNPQAGGQHAQTSGRYLQVVSQNPPYRGNAAPHITFKSAGPWEGYKAISIREISHDNESFCLSFANFSNQTVSCTINITRGIEAYPYDRERDGVRFFPKGDKVLYNSNKGNRVSTETVCTYDNVTKELSPLVHWGTDKIALSPNGRYVALANLYKICIIDVAKNKSHTIYESKKQLFLSLKFSPDGCHLLAHVNSKTHQKLGVFVFSFVDPTHKKASSAPVEVEMEDEKAELQEDLESEGSLDFEPPTKRRRTEKK